MPLCSSGIVPLKFEQSTFIMIDEIDYGMKCDDMIFRAITKLLENYAYVKSNGMGIPLTLKKER